MFGNVSRLRSRLRGGSSGGGSAPAFSLPTDIAGLKLWLDASDSVVSSGGAVSQITDKSGNSHHATQSTTGSKPTTGAVTVNGLNAVTFDGTNDTLAVASGIYPVTNGASTVLSVYIMRNTNSTVLTGRDASNRYRPLHESSTTVRYCSGDTTGVVGTIASDTINPHIIGHTGDSSLFKGIYDGVPTLDATRTPFVSTAFHIGSNNNAGNFANMDFCECVIYDSELSMTDLNNVGNYLADKWGVSWTDAFF